MNPERDLGVRAEDEACKALSKAGCRVVDRNYSRGRGEIDVICLDGGTICFVEVKARSSSAAGSPGEAVGVAKRKKMVQVAVQYLKEKRAFDSPVRFDVVEVVPGSAGLECRIIKGAFGTEDLERGRFGPG